MKADKQVDRHKYTNIYNKFCMMIKQSREEFEADSPGISTQSKKERAVWFKWRV